MYVYLYFKGIPKRKGSQVLQCPQLTNPEWGIVNIMQNARGLFTAVYKCLPQHSISGDRLRFCSPTSGQWSGSTPRCLPSKTFNHSLYLCMHACMRTYMYIHACKYQIAFLRYPAPVAFVCIVCYKVIIASVVTYHPLYMVLMKFHDGLIWYVRICSLDDGCIHEWA